MSNTFIRPIPFEECAQIWASKLWPGRTDIEPVSAMMYAPEADALQYDMRNMTLPAIFFGLYEDDRLVGVNSGHQCGDESFRSRGLWVDPAYRGKGHGIRLLCATIAYACAKKSTFIWSYPRLTSRATYESSGFSISSTWRASDTSDSNAYCILKFGDRNELR